MARITVRATVKVAWWWRYYVGCVVLMSRITGLEPDVHKVGYWAARAVTVKLLGVKPDGQG